MRGVLWSQAGGPDTLAARDGDDVHAAGGQVRVRTEASPVLWVETQMRAGLVPSPAAPPTVFGSQAVGLVDEVGDGVDPQLIGTRVAVSGVGIGAHAEFVCAAVEQCVAVPDAIGAVDAAVALTGVPVALALLERAGDLSDATVLVEAAGSGIGAYLTQLRGQLLSYGMLSGEAPRIVAADLYAGGFTVTACAGPAWLDRVAALRSIALDRVADGTVRPVVDSTMPLDAVATAHRRIDERATSGTIVLVP